ncbi:hypothetical protein A3B32_00835 [Candidatus Uhrbacteria bacterium RIFCSPLOWO2_01_FULL_53_9]|uniref:DUF5667 domain-containing protein n=3 Tax=Candidatus Uhriibacteriota TaxID=1752732 RepID=A0A1F7UYC3_9BACT|nr:MAG: hypothetical protein A3C17_04260 [Candidatus Uhrbacteria bacterium RIFCSPHIGHO2_02_FULL_53_13]OGL83270.1 MAG: hypothetical protein A3B32_00835 [Candidatus Uhrbacteria bacterium RIFCSPLOWO2_01_FULL_53_9]OGL89630.1 MAG: hypothetical protein A3I45_04745 [Candidatus Uhrbacteria bacterium RIFCSPLOWO2_02_FULL_53_10]
MNSPLEQRLKELSNRSSWRLDDGVREETRKRLLMLEAPVTAQTASSLLDSILRLPHDITEMVARPYAIVSLVVVMMLGGWITSVNASLDTLPGDTFYSVKIASEQAQLTFAGTEARNRLRAQFASRRLNEVTTLVERGSTDKDARVKVAIQGFEKQIEAAQNDLKKSPSDAQAIELARLIDHSKSALDQAISVSESVHDATSTAALVASQGSTDAAHTEVVNVLSSTASDSVVSAGELSRQFTNEVRDILGTTTVLSGRLDLIERVVNASGRTDIEIDIAAQRRALHNVDVAGAQDFAARGGYNRAFELTNAIQRHLRAVELIVASAEIALTKPVTASEVINEDVMIVPETANDKPSVVIESETVIETDVMDEPTTEEETSDEALNVRFEAPLEDSAESPIETPTD